jgi:hypothetical protein
MGKPVRKDSSQIDRFSAEITSNWKREQHPKKRPCSVLRLLRPKMNISEGKKADTRVPLTLTGSQKNPRDTAYQAATVVAALLLLISAAVL